MKIITKDSDYAVRAIMHLEKNRERFVSSSEISRKENIPLIFLRRILQKLIKGKIAESKEGVSGGVKLIVSADKISVANVINIIQGQIQLIECMFREKACENRAKCILRKKVMGIEENVIEEFSKLTIRDLVDEGKG
ncbi:MAG: Rrf2 family transcriptional regulator [Candidatus Omnitrophica bacterium]|nr:Rrf2 family transcriptional regulator [Candidatus Omnitrophota bacterium]